MNNNPAATKRELNRDERETLLHRVRIYGPDAPHAVKNHTTNFRDLFTDRFTAEEVLWGVSEAFRTCIIGTVEREAYRQLFTKQ